MAASYRLPDEPRPSALSHLVVHPMWPLFAIMFGGAWLAWPWFVFNGWALGSPTRVRETLMVLGGFLGNAALFFGLLLAQVALELPDRAFAYLLVLHTVWKLGVTYALSEVQGRGFELYTWYGGPSRNGLLLALLGGMLLRPRVAELVTGSPLLMALFL